MAGGSGAAFVRRRFGATRGRRQPGHRLTGTLLRTCASSTPIGGRRPRDLAAANRHQDRSDRPPGGQHGADARSTAAPVGGTRDYGVGRGGQWREWWAVYDARVERFRGPPTCPSRPGLVGRVARLRRRPASASRPAHLGGVSRPDRPPAAAVFRHPRPEARLAAGCADTAAAVWRRVRCRLSSQVPKHRQRRVTGGSADRGGA